MMSPKKRFPIITTGLLLLVLGLFLATPLLSPVLAQDAEATRAVSDDEVNEVAKEVYCPVCENTPLDVCQTQACADWRDVIRTKLNEGQSKEDVFEYFASQYGDRVLATPPQRGLNLLLWIWPVAALLGGGFFFMRYMKDLRGNSATITEPTAVDTPSPTPPTSTNSDDYISRVEQELNK